jgi:hypothetical protein
VHCTPRQRTQDQVVQWALQRGQIDSHEFGSVLWPVGGAPVLPLRV